SSI
ncbi:methyltransferase domain protein, partial [Vibrio parahaemolyticus V-223/04]